MLSLTILGIVVTAGLGAWALRLSYRARYPGKITYIHESRISLFDSIVRNLPELTVLHHGAPIEENVVLLKGNFLNTGTKDVTEQMIYEPLTAALPDGHKWLSGQVTASSRAATAYIDSNDERVLTFAFNFLRSDEYIKFEGLVEVPSTAKRGDLSLCFDHGIVDTQKVGRAVTGESAYDVVLAFFLTTAALFFFVAVGILGGELLSPTTEIIYQVSNEQGNLVDVTIAPQATGILKVEGRDNPYFAESTVDAFFAECDCNPKVIREPRYVLESSVGGLILAIISVTILALMAIRRRQKRRISGLIAESTDGALRDT